MNLRVTTMGTKANLIEETQQGVMQLGKGLATAIPDGTPVVVNMTNYTKAELIAKFKACEEIYGAEAAMLAAIQATMARAHAGVDMGPFANGLASILVTMVGAKVAAGCGVEVGKEKAPAAPCEFRTENDQPPACEVGLAATVSGRARARAA